MCVLELRNFCSACSGFGGLCRLWPSTRVGFTVIIPGLSPPDGGSTEISGQPGVCRGDHLGMPGQSHGQTHSKQETAGTGQVERLCLAPAPVMDRNRRSQVKTQSLHLAGEAGKLLAVRLEP